MPVFALKASRTLTNAASSAPPHREVTVMLPPAAALPPPPVEPPGAAVPPDPPHAAINAATTASATTRSDRVIPSTSEPIRPVTGHTIGVDVGVDRPRLAPPRAMVCASGP